ncbi:hypothetical protein GmHk_08G024210 [Glycine max]|nr:hypothetical protein GmHk_08G024210 [Glycine max]
MWWDLCASGERIFFSPRYIVILIYSLFNVFILCSIHSCSLLSFDQGFPSSPGSARGSQRDRDRERAQARTGAKGKQKDDGLTPEQRRERDAKALQEKAAKKAAQGAGGNNAAGSKK